MNHKIKKKLKFQKIGVQEMYHQKLKRQLFQQKQEEKKM